jgi:hypothetical protein
MLISGSDGVWARHRAHLSPVLYIRDPPLSGEHIREVSRLSWKWRKRSPVKIIGRTIGQTTQALVYVPGAVPSVTGTGNLAPLGEAANTARLHLEAAGTSLPNAQASVAVNSLGLLDLVQIAAKGLSPKAQYQVYLAESEAEPFGRLEPLAALKTNPDGAGIVQSIGPLKTLAGTGAGGDSRRFLIVTKFEDRSQVVLRQARPSTGD